MEPFDWGRMFIGDAPPLFLAEIAFRTVFIYAYALLLLRWIGGRSVAQLSIVEFLLVIALGSAIGDVTFYPDVPILHAMTVVTCVVLIDKAIDLAMRRYRTAKRVFDGDPVPVVQDGRILKDGTLARQLGDLELMEMLRRAGVANLGQVRSAYLESDGNLSVFRREPPQPGLRIEPPVELLPYPLAGPGTPACCTSCGNIHAAQACPACGAGGRTPPLPPAP